jgi:hypothetical protein
MSSALGTITSDVYTTIEIHTGRLLSEGIAFAEFNGGAFKWPIIAIGHC